MLTLRRFADKLLGALTITVLVFLAPGMTKAADDKSRRQRGG